MKNHRAGDVDGAMDQLVRGYEEEKRLYARVRNLTWKQRLTLRCGEGLDRFGDLLDEKQDLLRMIGEIEARQAAARSLVLDRKPLQCPNRWKLEALLDGLAETILRIRALERANLSLLRAGGVRRSAPVFELAR